MNYPENHKSREKSKKITLQVTSRIVCCRIKTHEKNLYHIETKGRIPKRFWQSLLVGMVRAYDK